MTSNIKFKLTPGILVIEKRQTEYVETTWFLKRKKNKILAFGKPEYNTEDTGL